MGKGFFAKVKNYFIHSWREFLWYTVAGTITVFVNLSSFAVMVSYLNMDVTVSNIISIILAIIAAYFSNKLLVFHTHCENMRYAVIEFSEFVGGRLLTMALEVGGVYVSVNIMGMKAMIGKLSTQIFVIIGNFFISKLIVFREREK